MDSLLPSGASAAALLARAMGGMVMAAGVMRREMRVGASMAVTAAITLGLGPGCQLVLPTTGH
jgi:hypothetical protein